MANDFAPFAGDPAANVMPLADYLDPAFIQTRTLGYQTGVAVSMQFNRTWRQASLIAATIGEFINAAGLNALDDGSTAGMTALLTNFTTAVKTTAQTGMVGDAPSDGKQYGRLNATWTAITPQSISAAPTAPIDGKMYGQLNAIWGVITHTHVGAPPEAPTDGVLYGRRNAIWQAVPGGTPDAPNDGVLYGRKSNAWSAVPLASGITQADADLRYVNVTGDTMTGPLSISGAKATTRSLFGQSAGSNRWQLAMADNTAESTGNKGSDWTLARYSDAGAIIDVVMRAHRDTGIVDFPKGILLPPPAGGAGDAGGSGSVEVGGRFTLKQTTYLYVESTRGDDKNDGLYLAATGNTPLHDGPVKTLTRAWAVAKTIDLNGHVLHIQCSNYSYRYQFGSGGLAFADGMICDGPLIGQTDCNQVIVEAVDWRGYPGAAETYAVRIQATSGPAIAAINGAMITVCGNFRLYAYGTSTRGPLVGLWSKGYGSILSLRNIDNGPGPIFDNCGYGHFFADSGRICGPYGYDTYYQTALWDLSYGFYSGYYGNASMYHWRAINNGIIDFSMCNLNYLQQPNYYYYEMQYWALAEYNGLIRVPGRGTYFPYGGSNFQCQRYYLHTNGLCCGSAYYMGQTTPYEFYLPGINNGAYYYQGLYY